jgi:electron transport complex protein RnfC
VLQPGLYRVPIGMRFSDLLIGVRLRHTPHRVVDGGPLTGNAVASLDAVVTRQTRGVLALDRASDYVPAPGPCVRCGWCQEDCPVGLNPQAILDRMERGDIAGAQRLVPQACIGCGLCSYVCPAELPLAPAAQRARRLAEEDSTQRPQGD